MLGLFFRGGSRFFLDFPETVDCVAPRLVCKPLDYLSLGGLSAQAAYLLEDSYVAVNETLGLGLPCGQHLPVLLESLFLLPKLLVFFLNIICFLIEDFLLL